MATDYDAPRRNESEEPSEDSLEELKARRNEAQSAVVDIDEGDTAESFELPGADLSGEELTVKVIPKQAVGQGRSHPRNAHHPAGPAVRWAISTGRTACQYVTCRRSTWAGIRWRCGWR